MTSLVPGIAESVTTPVLHLEAGVTEGATGKALTVRSEVTEPIIAGVLPIIRIMYAVPAGVPLGIFAVIVPDAVEITESSKTGVLNERTELLSWATKRLPAVNVPVMVYGILMVAPAQMGEVTFPIVIVCAIPVVKIITSMVSNKIPFFIFILFYLFTYLKPIKPLKLLKPQKLLKPLKPTPPL
jgi:hypothetical protein